MVHLTLQQGSSLLTMLAVAGVALLLAGLFYRRVFRQLSPGRWRLLFGLRTLAIVLVLMLLFRPILSLERDEVTRRGVVLLVDASASMSIQDDASGVSRFDQARTRAMDWSARLGKAFNVKVVEFSGRATALAGAAALAGLKPEGEATSITRGLSAAARALPRQDTEAVLLFSDGIQNASGDPVSVARRLGLVVHAVGVGNSLRNSPSYRDARVVDIECPEQLPIGNRARITAHVGQVGLGGQVLRAVLEEDGKAIDQAEVVFKDGEGPREVAFGFVPTVKGRHAYAVKIPAIPDEKISANNTRTAVAQVVETKLRVLYLEGTLRAEYGALVQRFFSKDPDLHFCALVQTRPGVFLQRTNMEGLQLAGLPGDAATFEKFDVFLLGDLDSSVWKPGALDLLAGRVRSGAGLLMMGGYHGLGPGGYGSTPLESILPVRVGGRDIGQLTDPFLPVLTPVGREHPIFANIARFFPTSSGPPQAEGLPPLDGSVRVQGPRPGAQVLATYPGEGGTMPILSVQPAGKGRTAVFTSDTTRNWQQVPRAMDQESPFLRFWGQVIRWLASRKEMLNAEASLTARTDKAYYEPDSSITIQATVRGRDGEGTDKAAVVAKVMPPDGADETITLISVSGSAGSYRGIFEPKGPGTLAIDVEAKLGEQALKSERISAEVGRPQLEFEHLDLDDALLGRIAAAAGGRYYHISTAEPLLGELDRRERRRHVSLEQPLSEPKIFWSLFVGAVAGEWLLRRRFQLR